MENRSNYVPLRLAIPAGIVVLSAFICLILGTVGYYQAKSSLSKSLNEKLHYVARSETQSIEKIVNNSISTIENITTDHLTYKAINLQHQMLVSKPEETKAFFQPEGMPVEERVKQMGDATNTYTFAHGEIHSIFLPYWRDLGASDILIVNDAGLVTYSVSKGDEFLQEVTGEGMGALKAIYDRAIAARSPETFKTAFVEYELAGEASMFLAHPVFTRSATADGAPVGVVIIRISASKISRLLDASNAIENGVSFFVADGQGRVVSDGAGERAGDPESIPAGFLSAGQTSGEHSIGALGRVISSSVAFSINDQPYYLVGVRSQAEALAGINDLRNWMIGLSALVAIIFCGLGIGFSHLITGPIVQLTEEMKQLAAGNTDVGSEYQYASREIAEMIATMHVFRENIRRVEALTHEKEETDQLNAEARRQMMQDLRGSFGEVVAAAAAGRFSERVEASFEDEELNEIAAGINTLVGTVDEGLSDTVDMLAALADGDLTVRMRGEYNGAFARLKESADQMAGRMDDMLGRIASVSGAVQKATDEISSGIVDLSMRTEHQASSLEETTASMEELSATVRQNADNAQEANQVAIAARESAVTGGEVAGRAVAAMGGIEDSSRQIAEIVGLIQEIAFQTNLPALNASVEAARAGEAGRGFAVVANEVRGLAQRAASASKDIKQLITNSGDQVEEGARLVNEAGEALQDIVTAVKKVADYVSEIDAASREQTAGIDQVSSAVTGMDEMTQQNAALVEETTAAIQSAKGQVNDLQAAVGTFKTAQSGNQAMAKESTDAGDDPVQPLRDMADQMAGRTADGPTVSRKSAAAGSAAAVDALTDEDWEEF
jgi:methyl-accepting chemotaxis protein